jgi:adenine-specific DNA-methyltransferase
MKRLLAAGEIVFGVDHTTQPQRKYLLRKNLSENIPSVLGYGGSDDAMLTELGIPFEHPKPVDFARELIGGILTKDDILMDFFAGSGTAAHATMLHAISTQTSPRWILVQIPEPFSEENKDHAAAVKFCRKHSLPLSMAELSKERIRRAGAKVKATNTSAAADLDIGFRVLKIDTSNMKDVYYDPDKVKQDELFKQTDNIKEDRTPEDLLFQVLVDWGVDLALPIVQETIAKKKVFFVDGNALAACFDPNIPEDLVKELAKRKPLRAVFRDSSYGSDSVKINVEQIFKLLSPATELKSL